MDEYIVQWLPGDSETLLPPDGLGNTMRIRGRNRRSRDLADRSWGGRWEAKGER